MALSNNEIIRLEARDKSELWFVHDQYRGMKPTKPVSLNYPASAIGLLISHFDADVVQYGTATLVHRNIIVTAASNVYKRETGLEAKSIVFISSSPDGGQYRSKKISFPSQFKNTQSANKYNFAIIELDKSCHLELGFLGISLRTQLPQAATIFGYKSRNRRLSIVEEAPLERKAEMSFVVLECQKQPNDFLPGSPILVWNKWKDDIQVIGIYTQHGQFTPLQDIKTELRNSNMQQTAPSEQIMLCDPQHPSSIVQDLVNSPDHWNHRIFTLGILSAKYGVGSPSILRRIRWTALRTLNLFDCQLKDQDLKDLSMGSFVSLDKLYLCKNPYGNEGIEAICRGSWRDLSQLYLWATQTNLLCLFNIIRSFPLLKVLQFSESPHGMAALISKYAKAALSSVQLKT